MTRAARHRGGGGRPALADQWEHARPQVVAVRSQLRIAFVFHPGEPLRTHPPAERGARHGKQRSHQHTVPERRNRRHRRKPRHARPAQELQQHRLELIVLVMCGEQRLAGAKRRGEEAIALRARGSLERLTARTRDGRGTDRERHLQPPGDASAVCAPAPRSGEQAMVDVQGAQRARRPRQLTQRREQRGGVGATTEGDAETDLREGREQLAQA